MRPQSRGAGIPIVLVLGLAAILIVLAILQIRWTAKVSQADRERMQANLHTETGRFRRDFNLQLLRICWAFQPPDVGSSGKALKFYADRYDDWMSASARPDIVRGIFVWDRATGRLLRLDPVSARFKPSSWPANLRTLRRHLTRNHVISGAQAESINPSWILDEESHALFHLFSGVAPPGGGVMIDLNMDFIWRTLTPELVGRYFRGPGGSEYRVSVVSGGNPPVIYYQSSPSSPTGVVTGDIAEDLVRRSAGALEEQPPAREETAEGEGRAAGPIDGAQEEQRDFLPLISVAGAGNSWRLVVRHRAGSVEEAVMSLRHRNLAVSLSVLLLLAISMALLVVSAQRAQRLARAQLNFMAGVSHELRTPLAVICSAAENLADGVVGAPEQVKNYGGLIRDEGRRLAGMVGQILDFAAGRGARRAYEASLADPARLIEAALANMQPSFDSGRVAVETHIARELPPVFADPAALGRCIQNLISNAIKYGGESRWLAVSAVKAATQSGADEVQISVKDRGLGIEPEDLPHIFEPFYRGKNSSNGGIHGTGLGLSIAKELAEAAGGWLSVTTEPGRGSLFTLHLPACAPMNEALEESTRRAGA